ncbi:uncharacterized protein METZ01_LOCUS268460, partial [marine metagenome]
RQRVLSLQMFCGYGKRCTSIIGTIVLESSTTPLGCPRTRFMGSNDSMNAGV